MDRVVFVAVPSSRKAAARQPTPVKTVQNTYRVFLPKWSIVRVAKM